MSGLTPCYTNGGNIIKISHNVNADACDNAVCTWSNNGYRLPTEGEWQFAASNRGITPYNYASGATMDYTNTMDDFSGTVKKTNEFPSQFIKNSSMSTIHYYFFCIII
jgi:hypothetical protein